MFKRILLISLIMIILPALIYAAVADYLILQDMGSYKFITQSKNPLTKKIIQIPGYTTRNAPGVLVGADHFDLDHDDTTYETDYESDITDLGVEVQVTQHAGSDSDKWLLHEVEDGYRDGDDSDGRLGRFSGAGVKIRDIGGNKFLYWGLGGGSYSWISGLKVIEIKYTDLQRTKPEPIEVVQAYLQKHPSTIVLTDADLKSKAHDEQWIKDEMDRRLWLCDKWFEQLQLGKAAQKDVLEEAVKSMNVFLDYREKYYGIKAADEKNTLQGYLYAKDETNIRNKLAEYKTWWSANKTGSLIGILSIYMHKTFNHVSSFFKRIVSFLSSLWRN
jgi:hypothetical protein